MVCNTSIFKSIFLRIVITYSVLFNKKSMQMFMTCCQELLWILSQLYFKLRLFLFLIIFMFLVTCLNIWFFIYYISIS